MPTTSPLRVHDGAARVARIDRGVGLDEVGVAAERTFVRIVASGSASSLRWRLETIPRVTVQPNPRALPIARSSSPTLTASESPKVAGRRPRDAVDAEQREVGRLVLPDSVAV